MGISRILPVHACTEIILSAVAKMAKHRTGFFSLKAAQNNMTRKQHKGLLSM